MACENDSDNSIPMCIPGDRLCGISDAKPGAGTYVKNGLIFASIRGILNITIGETTDGEKLPLIAVLHLKQAASKPEIGSIVCCRVTSVHKTYVRCTIMSVNNVSTICPFNGVIQWLETISCFKPGDIILARVISLGEPDCYYLSTLEPELGVVIGLSRTNQRMYPVSWNRMRAMKTSAPCKSESRKVARVRPEYVITDQATVDGETIEN